MKWSRAAVTLVSAAVFALAPARAQVRTIDPNNANADLAPVPSSEGSANTQPAAPPPPAPAEATAAPEAASPATPASQPANPAAAAGATYHQEDVISAAEGVFGKGAEGLAKMIESILKD